MRLIDADALKEIFETEARVFEIMRNRELAKFSRSLAERVETRPTVDAAEVVHGEWIANEFVYRTPMAKNYHCSKCQKEGFGGENYCPNCGAKMDGGDK